MIFPLLFYQFSMLTEYCEKTHPILLHVFLEKLSKFQQIKTRSRTEIPEKGNIGNAPTKFSRS